MRRGWRSRRHCLTASSASAAAHDVATALVQVGSSSIATAPPDAPASATVCWEVRLAGSFSAFTHDEQERLEQAFLAGEAAVSVRDGTREVSLVGPAFKQRAAVGFAPCKEREVRRRLV